MANIAIFSGYYYPHVGGIEVYTDKLSQELCKRGHSVTIVTSKFRNDLEIYEAPSNSSNYSLIRLPILKQNRIINKFLSPERYCFIDRKSVKFQQLFKKLCSTKFDLIINNTRFHQTTQIGLELAKLQNRKAIVIEHGAGPLSLGNHILDVIIHKFEKSLTKRVKGYNPDFYGVSQAANDWINQEFNITAKGVLYNSVDKSEYELFRLNDDNTTLLEGRRINENWAIKNTELSKINSTDFNIFFAGRLIREKGIDITCEAVNNIINKTNSSTSHNLHLWIAGDGPLFDELFEKYGANDLPNSRYFHFLGRLNHEEIMFLAAAAAAAAASSYWAEGLPTTILEAGLMKCSVIATQMGGTAEVIKNDETGIIISPNVNELQNAIERLINDHDLCKKLANNLHNLVIEKFTWDKVAKKVEQILT